LRLRFSTGSSVLYAVLGSGVKSNELYEIFGQRASGLSAFCHTLSVTALSDVEKKSVYIDTENGAFRAERILQLSARYNLNPESVLSRIWVLQPPNSEHLSDTIGTLSAKFAQDNSYKLVIVDSILALFRIDYEANELADRQRNVNRFLTDLLAMAQQWNIAVMITNKVIVRQGQGAMPTGGRYFVAHVSTTRGC